MSSEIRTQSTNLLDCVLTSTCTCSLTAWNSAATKFKRMRMQPQFRLIDHDQIRQVVYRLLQQGDQTDGSQRTVRQLMRTENEV